MNKLDTARQEGEDFEQYRERLREQNKAKRQYRKGRLVWNSTWRKTLNHKKLLEAYEQKRLDRAEQPE